MKFRPSVAIIVWMLSIAASLAIVSSLGAQNSTTPASSAKRAITEKDLFDFVWVANPQLSPDGSRVAFTRVNVDDKRTGYETSIWMVATSGNAAPVRMTSGKHDAQPRWSPDGKQIAFTRGGDKDESGKPKPPQIALLSLTGGEAWIITDLPKGATDAVWSPDSKRIAFTSSTTPEDIEKALDAILNRWRSPELLLDDLARALQRPLVPKLGEHDEPRTQRHDHQDR